MRTHLNNSAGFAALVLLLMLSVIGAIGVLAIVHGPADALIAKENAERDAKWTAACNAEGGEIRTRTEKRLRYNYRNRYETVTSRYCYKQLN